MSILTLLDMIADDRPDAIAVHVDGASMTYGDIRRFAYCGARSVRGISQVRRDRRWIGGSAPEKPLISRARLRAGDWLRVLRNHIALSGY